MLSRLAFTHRSALLVVVGTGVAALALDAPPAGALEVSLAVALTIAGAHLRLVSIRVLGKSARVHHAGGRALHVVGPYARLRNPLYVANGLITGGLALLAGGPVALATAMGLVALVYHLAVLHEEQALVSAFGDAYREYLRRVPRWLPAPKARQSAGAPVPVAWPEVLRRERALVLGVPIALLAVHLVRLGALPLVPLWKRVAVDLGAPAVPLLLGLGAAAAIANAANTERKLRRKQAKRLEVDERATSTLQSLHTGSVTFPPQA